MKLEYSLSKEEAKELLKPYAQLFYDAIVGGFGDYDMNDKQQAHIHNKTTKSNLVRSYVLHRVKQIVARFPELKLKEQKRMFAVVIADKVILRFKKLDSMFRSRNVQTKQVKAFRKRELTFQGVKALPIDAGWRVDQYYAAIEDVHFVCPDGTGNLWRIPLEDLSIQKKQTTVFPIAEQEVIAVVTVKPELADDITKTADQSPND
jgi:hypothetical protein